MANLVNLGCHKKDQMKLWEPLAEKKGTKTYLQTGKAYRLLQDKIGNTQHNRI